MIIAMDGPAGAGKSTVARRVAQALGLPILDTGAMYRAVTLVVLDRGVSPADADGCSEVADGLDLDFDDQGRIRIDGQPGEPKIRSEPVTLAVSIVSAHPKVRESIVRRQRVLGERPPGVVAEGRDTTTVVFPEAAHKFFLIASPRERARRRALEQGDESRVESIMAEILERDHMDSTRDHSPMVQASDAVLVNTDGLDLEEVVARILDVVRARGAHG